MHKFDTDRNTCRDGHHALTRASWRVRLNPSGDHHAFAKKLSCTETSDVSWAVSGKQRELKRTRINRRTNVRVVRTNARANDRPQVLTIDEPRKCNEALAARSHRPRIRRHDLLWPNHQVGQQNWWRGSKPFTVPAPIVTYGSSRPHRHSPRAQHGVAAAAARRLTEGVFS